MRKKLMVLFILMAMGCGAEFNGAPSPPAPPKTDDPKPADPPPVVVVPDMGNGDASCGGMQFALERVPPNVMLVVDRSGSMGGAISSGSATTKWTDLKNALQQLVTGYDAMIRLGVTLYSSDGNCGAGTLTAIAPSNGATVLQKLNAQGPAGNTPTAPALAEVIKNGKLDDVTRENYVVLATDGLPNCGDVDVKGKIDTLYKATPPVKTFVIGVGDGTASDPVLLNAWAVAGHTERAGATKYYQTNSQAELKAAFDAIAGGIVSCTFKMASTPPDPSQLFVWSNGVQVPADPANGYTYDAAGPTVTLHGTTCDALKSNAATKIQVVYGCPAPPPIN